MFTNDYYLIPYNCVQTNDDSKIEVITWNHVIVYKLLVLNRNTWNPNNGC